MLIDFPDSQLIAAGVPKGKVKKDGSEHIFYTLAKRAESGEQNFKRLKYTSYDSPFLRPADIEELEKEISAMDDQMVAQEIYGEFIDYTNTSNPFIYNFDENKHIDNSIGYNPAKQLLVSIDFNINPITAIFAHAYRDNLGEHLHIFNEKAIDNGSPEVLAEYIKTTYPRSIPTLRLTGDAMGRQKNISQRDNASNYDIIKYVLRLRSSQIEVKGNPTHENSRTDCNYFLANYKNFKINANSCKNLIFDIKNVGCDIYGGIIKRNRMDFSQKADFLDNFRYLVNTFLKDWIKRDGKLK